eukprot:747686-Hanusia_phi.AAC.4
METTPQRFFDLVSFPPFPSFRILALVIREVFSPSKSTLILSNVANIIAGLPFFDACECLTQPAGDDTQSLPACIPSDFWDQTELWEAQVASMVHQVPVRSRRVGIALCTFVVELTSASRSNLSQSSLVILFQGLRSFFSSWLSSALSEPAVEVHASSQTFFFASQGSRLHATISTTSVAHIHSLFKWQVNNV